MRPPWMRTGPVPVPSWAPDTSAGPGGPLPIPFGSAPSQFTKHGGCPFSGVSSVGSIVDTIGPGADAGVTGSATVAGAEAFGGNDLVMRAGAGVAITGGGVGGAGPQSTIGPAGSGIEGSSAGVRAGNSSAAANAAAWAAIDK